MRNTEGYKIYMNTVIYASVACSQVKFETLFGECNAKPGQADQKYNRLIMEGIGSINGWCVEAVTAAPISRKTHNDILWRSYYEEYDGIKYNYLPIVNVKIIKDIINVFSSFFKTCKIIRMNDNVKVIADVLNTPVALGSFLASRTIKTPYTAIVTDDPELCGCGWFYKMASYFLIKHCDSFVFITENMNNRYNSENRPYRVVEGLVDKNERKRDETDCVNNNEKFIIMYTGSIHKKYGIEELVHGFVEANINNSELHIYGSGDYEDELRNLSSGYENVKYFGTVLSSEVVKCQRKAALLVNPRPIDEEFVYYSFPSKNMEYMVTGVPVLTTNLPGMPKEYKEYVYILGDYSRNGIRKMLIRLARMDKEKLSNVGLRAREFVLEKKNNIVQAKKILEMVEKL